MTQDYSPLTPKKPFPKHSYWGIASLTLSTLLAIEIAGATSLLPVIGTLHLPAFIAANIGQWSAQALLVSLILAFVGLLKDRKKIYLILSLVILAIDIVIVGLTILGLTKLTF
jgi:hypothetical protein